MINSRELAESLNVKHICVRRHVKNEFPKKKPEKIYPGKGSKGGTPLKYYDLTAEETLCLLRKMRNVLSEEDITRFGLSPYRNQIQEKEEKKLIRAEAHQKDLLFEELTEGGEKIERDVPCLDTSIDGVSDDTIIICKRLAYWKTAFGKVLVCGADERFLNYKKAVYLFYADSGGTMNELIGTKKAQDVIYRIASRYEIEVCFVYY